MGNKMWFWPSVCHHIGGKACNLSLLEDTIKEAVKKKWNCLFLGDTINNGVSAGSKHVGLEFQDSMDPMSQVERFVDLALPLAKAKLLKGMVGGNHPARSVKACGLHPEKIIAMLLSVAAGGEKPAAIMPAILQRIHEVAYLAKFASQNGRTFNQYANARDQLHREIARVQPGVEERWDVPFQPGIGSFKIEGVPVAAHHGTHGKSKDNWKQLWNAIPGHRLYVTGHNHSLDWKGGVGRIAGKKMEVDYFSCGTYQGYEEYASIACYQETEVGSLLIEYDKSTHFAKFVKLN